MATQSPFSLLEDAFQKLGSTLQPPAWAVQEVQRRIVLLLNHVLMQEKEAMARLTRQKGRVVLFQWREFSFKLQLTPAGLLDLAAADTPSDLTLAIIENSPAALVQAVRRAAEGLRGWLSTGKPAAASPGAGANA